MGIDNPIHLLFLAAVALLVLGPKRLPELARSLGKGIREFRESMNVGATGGFFGDPEGDISAPAPAPTAAPAPTVAPTAALAPTAAPAPASAVAPAPSPSSGDDGVTASVIQDADVVITGPSSGDVGQDSPSAVLAEEGNGDSPPAGDGAAHQVDPAEPVRSADHAPDRRPL
jgi:sec-independent protein translocase protein TatA